MRKRTISSIVAVLEASVLQAAVGNSSFVVSAVDDLDRHAADQQEGEEQVVAEDDDSLLPVLHMKRGE
jgi:hypothetical protein